MYMCDKFILYNLCIDIVIIFNLFLLVCFFGVFFNGYSDDFLFFFGIFNIVKLRLDCGFFFFKFFNFVLVDKCKINIIEIINKVMLLEGVNRERNGWFVVGLDDYLVFKIDCNFKIS